MLVLFLIFVLYLYLKPLKYLVQNALEVFVLLNYIILLVLRFTETILDSFNDYTGTLVPSDYGTGLPSYSSMDLFFAVIFYFPISIGVCICGFWIIVKIWYVSIAFFLLTIK